MSLPRFYAPDLDQRPLALSAPEARHAVQSRRLRSGDRVIVFDGQGREAHGILDAPPDDTPAGRRPRKKPPRVLIHIDQIIEHTRPAHSLRLIVAGCKGIRLEWMVEKCTELGVTTITIADFEHSVVFGNRRHTQRLGSTIREACKQSGRPWLPIINTGQTLFDALDEQAAEITRQSPNTEVDQASRPENQPPNTEVGRASHLENQPPNTEVGRASHLENQPPNTEVGRASHLENQPPNTEVGRASHLENQPPNTEVGRASRPPSPPRQESFHNLAGQLLAAHPDPNAEPLTTLMPQLISAAPQITAIVGPEGGLSSDEVDELAARGVRFVNLGQNILRIETAAIACAACWSAALPPTPA